MDKFDKGIELWETGHIKSARRIYMVYRKKENIKLT
jgi:hypothetical protein